MLFLLIGTLYGVSINVTAKVCLYFLSTDSFAPVEIRIRGPQAELAFQKAMQNGKVKVYRGRIMILGQDRAGKTSLKKSLLGMPFDLHEESTVGVEIDTTRFEVEVEEVKNWTLIKDKKPDLSEFAKGIAKLVAKDLNNAEVKPTEISQSASMILLEVPLNHLTFI